jgi:hypothetical protein
VSVRDMHYTTVVLVHTNNPLYIISTREFPSLVLLYTATSPLVLSQLGDTESESAARASSAADPAVPTTLCCDGLSTRRRCHRCVCVWPCKPRRPGLSRDRRA